EARSRVGGPRRSELAPPVTTERAATGAFRRQGKVGDGRKAAIHDPEAATEAVTVIVSPVSDLSIERICTSYAGIEIPPDPAPESSVASVAAAPSFCAQRSERGIR